MREITKLARTNQFTVKFEVPEGDEVKFINADPFSKLIRIKQIAIRTRRTSINETNRGLDRAYLAPAQ